MSTDNLGDRMKRYETTSQLSLLKRTPVIIRLDGKAFHTFTKPLKKHSTTPFVTELRDAMVHTTVELIRNIQGAVFAYTQSDEISILLRDWDTLETQAWYDYNVQKIVSVSASIATAEFNTQPLPNKPSLALFDSRAYNVPHSEVTNYMIWRQNDAIRNSVQLLGHSVLSQKEMHGKSNEEVKAILRERGVVWDNIQLWSQRGIGVWRDQVDGGVHIDLCIPEFTKDRNYIERHLTV